MILIVSLFASRVYKSIHCDDTNIDRLTRMFFQFQIDEI